MNRINVAVMNTSKEITDMLSEVLTDAGFHTTATFTYAFKNNESLFDEYLEANKPDVIVYDIAPPYRENYFFFERLYSRSSAKTVPFVLTTTNKDALESFVGKTPTHELIGKPFDLQEIIDSIKKAYGRKISVKMNSQAR
jgi:DNA-binding response OmpR family regulator